MESSSALTVQTVKFDEGEGTAREVVEALMETLIDPLLPSTLPDDFPVPSIDEQISVARQMHAVVLLYNYYHRKQRPEHKFLDFISFRKLAQSLRRSLIPYMKMLAETEVMEFNFAEEKLLVTEKSIENACHIAMELNASKYFPITEGYPITEIAILLVDPEKENCWLQFSAVTLGVWSLIEQEIDGLAISLEMLAEKRIGNKKNVRNQKVIVNDSKLLDLVHDAVKDSTGIDSSGLVILETQDVYSLRKATSATLFCLVQSPQSFNVKHRIPLKSLVEKLQLPIVKKLNNIWTTTASLDYFHVLPYLSFISSWFFSLKGDDGRKLMSTGKKETTETITLNSHSWNGEREMDHSDNHCSTVAVSSGIYENCDKNLDVAGSRDVLQSASKHGHVTNLLKKSDGVVSFAEEEGKNKFLEELWSKGLSRKRVRDENLPNKSKKVSKIPDSSPKEETGIYSGTLAMDLASPSPIIHGNNNSTTCHETADTIKMPTSEFHYGSSGAIHAQIHDSRQEEVVFKSEVWNDLKPGDEKAPVIEYESSFRTEARHPSASEELQNALALLYRKRQSLHSRMCSLVDMIAVCEYDIERVSDGGAHDEFVESEESERSKSCDSSIFVPRKFPCEELEYMCMKNKWRVARYVVERGDDGKFVSNVRVTLGRDLGSVRCKGGVETSPSGARASAASLIIRTICKLGFS